MKSNDEIFEGKSFSDLTKDIYTNQQNKRLQLDLLVMVAPLIKEFYEVSVKNDEHLVKLAGVIQRIIAKSTGAEDESLLLTEAEKEDLINALQDDAADLQKRSDEVENLKQKSHKIIGN